MSTFGLGIACCNEAHNIGRLLGHIRELVAGGWRPARLVVVSDACHDGTDDIVRAAAADLGVPLRLVQRPHRLGKASAVNRIIDALADCSIIGLISADVLPVDDCLPQLVRALENESVGVAGCRPLPQGPAGNLATEISRLLWAMHHEIALEHPKSTEITVFRNLGEHLDEASLTDEAEIEAMLARRGYSVAYLPHARVRLSTPLCLLDYLRQRTRVTRGHLQLAHRGYRVATLGLRHRLRALGRVRVSALILALGVVLESLVLLAACWRQRFGAAPDGVWGRIDSSKRPPKHE